MIDPVVTASGQNYEKDYITDWLMNANTCPHTGAVLSDLSVRPNLLVNDLIEEWCQAEKYDRRFNQKVTELDIDGLESLLHRISSASSVSDQTEAANELRRQITNFARVGDLFFSQLPDSITRMLTPLSGEVFLSNTDLQENIITSLFNISVNEKNRTVIAQNSLAIEVLTKSLWLGTDHKQRKSASTLWVLSVIDSNKDNIGNSKAPVALVHLIKKGDSVATRAAAFAVCNIFTVLENRQRPIAAGFISELIKQMRERKDADGFLLARLASISTETGVIEEMENLEFIRDLMIILRQSSGVIAQNAIVILFEMCKTNKGRLGQLKIEENQHETFTKLAAQGTQIAVQTAEAILQWLKTLG
ncbi:unnamed protein product [Arabis nemorensis]|uniref:RING-type E3 ubiquitin transferase n=1 Tax=Arabis nemorensis TaxID=586526 RepID=A0A565BC23_9BRAS|nr:unnamed protein product [Arabis nemorensis]